MRQRPGQGVRQGSRVDGVDPDTLGAVYDFDWSRAPTRSLPRLGGTGAIVTKGFADDHDLRVGDPFTVTTAGGRAARAPRRRDLRPAGVDPLTGDVLDLAGGVRRALPAAAATCRVRGRPTATTAATTAAIDRALAASPTSKLARAAGWIDFRGKGMQQFLTLLYVLLALSVVVSLFGMVNALVLTVFERTREIGMMRAVGMTRRQVRRMVRHESIITALIGAGLGLPLGLLVAGRWRARCTPFVIPFGSLVIFTVVAIVAGVLAAIAPARRASRLNVLQALHYE